jgi:hypothetical protein
MCVAQEGADQRIAAEMCGGYGGVGVEVQQASAALHRGGEIAEILQPEPALDVFSGEAQLGDAVAAGEAQGARVEAACHFLNSGDSASGEKAKDRLPVERRPVVEAHDECTLLPSVAAIGRSLGAQLRGRAPIHRPDGVVELANAREPSGMRDIDHREATGLNEHPCALRTLRAGERERPRAELGTELTMQVALAVGEPPREPPHALPIHEPIRDQAKRAGREVPPLIPQRRAGRRI